MDNVSIAETEWGTKVMPGRIEFSVGFQANKRKTTENFRDSFNMLLLGDFSGNSKLNTRQPLSAVDLDSFEAFIAKLNPNVALSLAAPYNELITISIRDFEDFHPDQLYHNLDIFEPLRELKKRLINPSSFSAAAAELQQLLNLNFEGAIIQAPESTDADGKQEAGQNLFDQLLDNRPAQISSEKAAVKPNSVQIESFLKKVIAPSVELGSDPDLERLLALLDGEVEKLMRTILHHPDFQSLEANWRALFECVTRLELNQELKLYVLDVSKDALAQALLGETIEDSWLFSLVVENTVNIVGGESWAIMAGLYYFGDTDADVDQLNTMAYLASKAGGAFITAPDDSLLGRESLASSPPLEKLSTDSLCQEAWSKIRSNEHAEWLGMVVPRFILRLPYGKTSDEIEHFQFEETLFDSLGFPLHSNYLWGNGAVACLLLVAQSYTNSGWDMSLGDNLDLTDLPFHTYKHEGETHMKPCAEVLLSERQGRVLLTMGLMPLLSYKDRNAVRLMGFQSVAQTSAAIRGAWSS